MLLSMPEPDPVRLVQHEIPILVMQLMFLVMQLMWKSLWSTFIFASLEFVPSPPVSLFSG